MMNSIYVTERDSDTLHEGFHDFWRLPQFIFIAGKLTWHQQQNRTILAQAVLEKKKWDEDEILFETKTTK